MKLLNLWIRIAALLGSAANNKIICDYHNLIVGHFFAVFDLIHYKPTNNILQQFTIKNERLNCVSGFPKKAT